MKSKKHLGEDFAYFVEAGVPLAEPGSDLDGAVFDDDILWVLASRISDPKVQSYLASAAEDVDGEAQR